MVGAETATAMRVVTMLLAASTVIGIRTHSPVVFESLVARIGKMLPSTVSHWALAGLGFVIASERTGSFTIPGVLSFVSIMLAIFFLLAGTWLINNIFDTATDEYANADRPTVDGTIPSTTFWAVGGCCIVVAVLLAASVNWSAVAIVAAVLLVNAVYSVPPFRLKSHALTNMFCNGTLGGFGFLFGTAAVLDRPTPFVLVLFVAVVIAVTVNIPYWDLKDEAHDAKSGSDTIVVRFGADTVRRGLMIALPATYVMFAVVLSLIEWVPVFGLLSAIAVSVLHVRQDDYHRLAYELDIVNGVNHLTLATLYVLG